MTDPDDDRDVDGPGLLGALVICLPISLILWALIAWAIFG